MVSIGLIVVSRPIVPLASTVMTSVVPLWAAVLWAISPTVTLLPAPPSLTWPALVVVAPTPKAVVLACDAFAPTPIATELAPAATEAEPIAIASEPVALAATGGAASGWALPSFAGALFPIGAELTCKN